MFKEFSLGCLVVGSFLFFLKKEKLAEMVTRCHPLSLDVPFVCVFTKIDKIWYLRWWFKVLWFKELVSWVCLVICEKDLTVDHGIAVSTTAYSHGTDSDLRLREALNPTCCVLGFVVMTLLGNGCSKNKANTSYLSWSTLTQKPISSVLLLTVSFYHFILIYTHT